MPPALGNRFEVESKAAEGCNRQENLAVSGWGGGRGIQQAAAGACEPLTFAIPPGNFEFEGKVVDGTSYRPGSDMHMLGGNLTRDRRFP